MTVGDCPFCRHFGSVPDAATSPHPHPLVLFLSALLWTVRLLLTFGHLGFDLFPLSGVVAGVPTVATHHTEGKHPLLYELAGLHRVQGQTELSSLWCTAQVQ